MGLMRVFWPSDAPTSSLPGVLVGFQNSESDLFVVGILQEVEVRLSYSKSACILANFAQFRHVENALAVGTLLRNSAHNVQQLLQRCNHSSLRALGVVNPTTATGPLNATLPTFYIDGETRQPCLRSDKTTRAVIQVIIYDRPLPSRMQYLSLKPITLALDDKIRHPSWDSAFEEEQKERDRREKLVEKLRLHKVISRPPSKKELALPMLVEQVNCSWELNALLQKNVGMLGRRMKRVASVSERMVDSANSLWDYILMALSHILWVWMWPVLAQVFISALMANRVAAEVILRALHWRPAASPDAPAIRDMSATAQQIDIRLQQFCYWPIQYLTLRKSRAGWGSITNSHPDYIRFYNSLWLVANDVIMGIAVGSYILDNSELAAAKIDLIFSAWSIDGLRRTIIWLMGWPGGLKLNTELANFLGDLFIWVIDYWSGMSCLDKVKLHADDPRLRQSSTSTSSHPDTGGWLFGFCWSDDANLNVLGSGIFTDTAHLFFLHCIGPHLSLAADHHDLVIPLISWQETQRAPKPNRLMRLRSRSAVTRNNPLHVTIFPVANRLRLLPDLCKCKGRRHRSQSRPRDWFSLPESLPALRRYAST
jgi:phosphatidylinositol glycan class Q protein